MSGHEEQQVPNEARDDNIIGSSVVLPVARSNILDYIYLSGISLLPVYGSGGAGSVGGGGGSVGSVGGGGGGGGVGSVGGGGSGGVSWNQYNDMDQAMASILSGSLYERNPVKKVIDEEACQEIKEHTFTAALAEEQKINSACGIWQEDFEEGEAIKILPCNHAFKSEAITKWLKEEKAECPICRQTLKSKEICCHENHDDGDSDDDDNDDDHIENGEMYGNDYAGAAHAEPESEPEPEPELNNDAIRINNIASRMIQSVAGRMHSNPHHGHQESISVPISHLIERRRNMIFQARNLVAARAAIPSSSGAAAASYSNAHREVRAVPGINEYNHININNRVNDNNNRIDDNNNNRIDNNNNRIDDNNNNRIDDNNNNRIDNNNNRIDNNNNNRVNDINPPILNIINNNYYNNNNYNNNNNNNNDDDLVSNQEQADIEEAIRRSLEQI
jgi:hypothetical protein